MTGILLQGPKLLIWRYLSRRDCWSILNRADGLREEEVEEETDLVLTLALRLVALELVELVELEKKCILFGIVWFDC